MDEVSYFNPRETSKELLEAMWVAREPLLSEVLESVRSQARSVGHQHWLLRGPLGTGKSHFQAMLYHRVHEQLSADWLPLWPSESGFRRMSSAGRLLEQLAIQLAAESTHHPEALPWLEGELDAMKQLPTAQRGDAGLAILRQASRELDRKLLVLIENFDQVLFRLRKGTDRKRIREVLQDDTCLLWVVTSPQKWLETSDPKHAMFNLFRERLLTKLSPVEVRELIGSLVKLSGDGDAGERLLGVDGRIDTIHAVTGGNPRLVVMLFDVMRGAQGIREAYPAFRKLLDEQTKYFGSRLDMLGPQEQEVVGAFCVADYNLMASEVAVEVGLPTNQVSQLIGRLVDLGFLERAGPKRSRNNYFAVSDDLLRLWYQYHMEGNKQSIRRLVTSLALLYEPRELHELIADSRTASKSTTSLLEREANRVLLHHLELAEGETVKLPDDIGELSGAGVHAMRVVALCEPSKIRRLQLKQLIERFRDEPHPAVRFEVQMALAALCSDLSADDIPAALDVLGDAIDLVEEDTPLGVGYVLGAVEVALLREEWLATRRFVDIVESKLDLEREWSAVRALVHRASGDASAAESAWQTFVAASTKKMDVSTLVVQSVVGFLLVGLVQGRTKRVASELKAAEDLGFDQLVALRHAVDYYLALDAPGGGGKAAARTLERVPPELLGVTRQVIDTVDGGRAGASVMERFSVEIDADEPTG